MLTRISIRDFISLERLDLEAGGGLTAITGETGAGKSVLLEALGLVLGGAVERRMVRRGQAQASVAAEFALPPDHPAFAVLAEAGLAPRPDEPLSLRRVARAQGPSRAFVNDEPVSAALLSAIGETLVEMHGQSASMGLMRASQHRMLLDQYAGNGALLGEVREAWVALGEAVAAREACEARIAEAAALEADLREALDGIDALGPEPGEAEALSSERAGLAGLARAAEALAEARAALDDGVESRLVTAAKALGRAARPRGDGVTEPESELEALSDGLDRAIMEVDTVVSSIAGLLDGLSDGERRLEEIESRLFALKGLARRHGVLAEDLPALRDRLAADLAAIEGGQEALAAALKAEQGARARFATLAARLTEARTAAGERLSAAVMEELPALRLAHARFRVAIAEGEAGAHGADRIGFEIATSPAAGFAPLQAIASGGETARIALALRVALAETGDAVLLVFDEIDQGVGGAVASAMGERLRRLALRRQVVAVTHSPQVAACGDQHWHAEKSIDTNGLGLSRVRTLVSSAREEEIARMLAGLELTGEARAAAGRLLEGERNRDTAVGSGS